MISRILGGFIAILIGVSLIGPLASEVYEAENAYVTNVSTWGGTVLNLVPGFFALGILGVGIAVCYGSLKDAGVL